jgi:hypothetical protein
MSVIQGGNNISIGIYLPHSPQHSSLESDSHPSFYGYEG